MKILISCVLHQEPFVQTIMHMAGGYEEGRACFPNYVMRYSFWTFGEVLREVVLGVL
jgi:hypothetical protein